VSKPKVAVVGAGQVGGSTAQSLIQKELADVVLIDVVPGLPQGKALDLSQAAAVEGWDCKVTGSNDYKDLAGAAIVVVTAGIARKPGMSRDDLLNTNAKIVGEACESIVKHAPGAIVVVVTNPLDVMTALAHKVTGFGDRRVFGMAGVLDQGRMRCFLAEALGVSVKDVVTLVLGSHGDSMVPVASGCNVAGVSVLDLMPRDRYEKIAQRTRDGGAEIVQLLKQGSAFYAPAASIVQMVASVLRDEGRVLPCCVRLNGQYGLRDVFIGVPAKLGARGVEQIIELHLSNDDLAALQKSAAHVKEQVSKLALS